MKKIIIVIALMAIIGTGTAFADHPEGWGIGIYNTFDHTLFNGTLHGFGAGLTIVFPGFPVFFYFDLTNNFNHVAAAGDYYFIDDNIDGPWHWYFGLGLGVASWINDKKLGLATALRIPIGVSVQPIDWFEFFIQAVPQVGIRFVGHEGDKEGFGIYNRFWGGNIGIRFWF